MPQRKLIIILALLVLLPLGLLAWQGWKINKDTQQLNNARFNSLVSARLNQVDTVVQSYFEEMQVKWSLLIPQWSLDKTSTRNRIEEDGNIRQIFVIDAQKIRTFPPTDNEITAAEKTFVNRLESIWRDPQILFSNQVSTPSIEQIAEEQRQIKNTVASADVIAKESMIVAGQSNRQVTKRIPTQTYSSSYESAEIVSSNALPPAAEAQMADTKISDSMTTNRSSSDSLFSSSTRQTSSADLSQARVQTPSPKFSKERAKKVSKKISLNNPNRQGWYMWHWGSDANLIFWQQGQDKSIVGVEMEPVRVKSDLISRLPDTVPKQSNDFRLRLVDTAGQVVYQWGNYRQGFDLSSEKPQQRRPLSYPLSSWSLEYYGEPFTQSGFSRYSLLLTFLGFSLFISALAWFLYREQTREMRLAEKRVQFVSQVSHELKTPLTNIRMYAEMLEQQVEDAEQPKRYLQVITDESKRLTRLISNVLNFSRAPRIHKRDVDANEVIRQSIEHFTPTFSAKGIVLNTELNAAKTIQCDPDILEQILNNLLSNVEKYAASGKRLDIFSEVNSKTNPHAFVLRVRDYGSGISRAERKHIFKPFYRIDDAITEGVSGTGIGLTIARQQAEYLGGTLEYIEVDQGACFKLTLPSEVKS